MGLHAIQVTEAVSRITMSELKKQYETAVDRKNNPEEGSYTTYLFNKGLEKILKKVGE